MDLAIDTDITDASELLRGRPKSLREASGHASTSMGDVVYPVRRSSDKPKIMVRTFLEGPTRRFEFKEPIILKFEECDIGIIARHSALRCEGIGGSAAKAIEEFCEMFEVQWEALVESPIGDLSPDSIRARQEFLALATAIPAE